MKKISKQALQKVISDSQPSTIGVTQSSKLQDDAERKRLLREFIAFAESLIRGKGTITLIAMEEK